MKPRLTLFLTTLLLALVAGQGFCVDDVRQDEKGTYLGALFSARKTGVVITHVLANSPAAKADLRRNDIILEYDRKPVRDANQLAKLIQGDKPDRKVPLVIQRAEKRQNIEVTLTLGPVLKLARDDDPEPPRPAAVSVRATPLDSGDVRLTIEYGESSDRKTLTCQTAPKDIEAALARLPERERQLVRIALGRLKALDAPTKKK